MQPLNEISRITFSLKKFLTFVQFTLIEPRIILIYKGDKEGSEMAESNINEEGVSVDVARRRLLKIGLYAAPTIILLGKVPRARASGYGGKNQDCSEDQNTQGNDDCQGDENQQ